jgi:C-terminal processing protease CtpA/Prc
MKRAVVVGERTVGGAYGGGRQNINDHLDLLLSTSRSVSTVTHTDWEGTGVQPDVPVPAAQALDVAIRESSSVAHLTPWEGKSRHSWQRRAG